MRKRLVGLIVALALAAPFAALAEDTHYRPGNTLVSLGVGAGSGNGWGFTLAAHPGIEVMIAKVTIADTVPFDFGLAAKGLVGFSTFAGYSYVHIGAGAFATMHWCPRGIAWEVDVLDPFDFWLGLGLAFTAHIPAATWPGSLLDFATAAGVNYYLSDRFALMFAGGYWGYGGGYVGVLYKLGKGEKLIKKEG